MSYDVRTPEGERLGGSNELRGAVDLAFMLATEPVRGGVTHATHVIDEQGKIVARFEAQQVAE